jgi:hypothetical protein
VPEADGSVQFPAEIARTPRLVFSYNAPMKKKLLRKSDGLDAQTLTHRGCFKAAVRDPLTGKIYTGFEHFDAVKKAEEDGVTFPDGQLDPAHTGFLRKDGTFYTREQTQREFGFRTSADLR